MFLLSLPFENTIRGWAVYLSGPDDPTGYSYFFGITPKVITGILLILILLTSRSKTLFRSIKPSYANITLVLFYLAISIISLFFQTQTDVILMGYSRFTIALLFYLLAETYFSNPHQKNKYKYYVISLVMFCTFIGIFQLIRQKPLGKFIELTPSFSPSGYFTTDGVAQYRVAGFLSHPVYFGSFLSILIPILIGFLWQLKPKSTKSKIFWIYLGLIPLSVIATLGTLSRSTWITFTAIIILFLFYHKKHPLALLSTVKYKILSKPVMSLIIAIVLIASISGLLITRLGSLTQLFNSGGSVDSRLSLNIQSLKMSLYKPLTGIGLNNFPLLQPLDQGVSAGYASPPHNTLLIFLVELGYPATLMFILFVILTMFKIDPFKLKPSSFGVWVGLVTFLISSQFHPLFNLDPTFDLFMLTLAYYSTCDNSKT